MHPMIRSPMDRVENVIRDVSDHDTAADPSDAIALRQYIENLEMALARLTTAPELRAILREASEAAWKGEGAGEVEEDEE